MLIISDISFELLSNVVLSSLLSRTVYGLELIGAFLLLLLLCSCEYYNEVATSSLLFRV